MLDAFEAPIQQHQAAALEIEFQQASGQAVLAYKVTAVIRWCPGHGQEIGLRDKDPQLPTGMPTGSQGWVAEEPCRQRWKA